MQLDEFSLLLSIFPDEMRLVIALFTLVFVVTIVIVKLGRDVSNPIGQIALSSAPGFFLLLIFVFAWRIGLLRFPLSIKLLFLIGIAPIGFILFLVCLPKNNPIEDKMKRAFRGTSARSGPLLRWMEKRLSMRMRLLIASLCVIAVASILTLSLLLRPVPFRVIIEQSPSGGSGGASGGSLAEMLRGLAGEMRGDDIEIILVPVDDNADLEIFISLQNSECVEPYRTNRWRWSADKNPELEMALRLFLVDMDAPRKELGGNPCDWTRLKQDLKALVYLARGLDAYYIGRTEDDKRLARSSFDAAYSAMGATTSSAAYSTLADDPIEAEYLTMPRHLHLCAQVMSAVARWPIEDEKRRELLRNAADQDPFGAETRPADLCVAQAHYWLGRDALERHLVSLRGENATASTALLVEAVDHFTHALDHYAELKGNSASILDRGAHWAYYFYRALARYRLGDFGGAMDDLSLADDNFATFPMNEHPREAVSYLCARLWLETAAYPALSELECGIRPQERPGFEDAVDALRYLQGEGEFGLAPLSVGTMSLFTEALYWEALARCAESAASPEAAARCAVVGPATRPPCEWGGSASVRPTLCPRAGAEEELVTPCLWNEEARRPADPGDCFRKMAVDRSEAASTTNLGDLPGRGPLPDPAPIDVFMALLYDLRNGEEVTLSEDTWTTFWRDAGAPAYVIPLRPAFGAAADDGIDRDESSLSFLWLLRNRYDEPVFDPDWPVEAPDPGTSCNEVYSFCLLLGDELKGFPLHDRGLGLFATEAVPLPRLAMEASPGTGETIELRRELPLALAYQHGRGGPETVAVGSLPVVLTVTNDDLAARVDVDFAVEPPLPVNMDGCSLCYNFRIDVAVPVDTGQVQISELIVRQDGERPDLVFSADLWEVAYVPSGSASCEDRWPPLHRVGLVPLHWDEEIGGFTARFQRMSLDVIDKYYSIHVVAKDRAENEKINTWICDIELPPVPR